MDGGAPEQDSNLTPAQLRLEMMRAAMRGEVEIHYWYTKKAGTVLEIPVPIDQKNQDFDAEDQKIKAMYPDASHEIMPTDMQQFIHDFLVDLIE